MTGKMISLAAMEPKSFPNSGVKRTRLHELTLLSQRLKNDQITPAMRPRANRMKIKPKLTANKNTPPFRAMSIA